MVLWNHSFRRHATATCTCLDWSVPQVTPHLVIASVLYCITIVAEHIGSALQLLAISDVLCSFSDFTNSCLTPSKRSTQQNAGPHFKSRPPHDSIALLGRLSKTAWSCYLAFTRAPHRPDSAAAEVSLRLSALEELCELCTLLRVC